MDKRVQMSLPLLSALVLAACGGGGGSSAPAQTGLLKNVPETYSVNIPKSLLSNGVVRSLRVAATGTGAASTPAATLPAVAAPTSLGYKRLQTFARQMKRRQTQIADQFVLVDKLWDQLVSQCQTTVVDEVCSVPAATINLTYSQAMADRVFRALKVRILKDDDLTQTQIDAALLVARARANGITPDGSPGSWPQVGDQISIDNEFKFTTLTAATAEDYSYSMQMLPAALKYSVVVAAASVAANTVTDAVTNAATDAVTNAASNAITNAAGNTGAAFRDLDRGEKADFTLKWSADKSRVSLLEEISKGTELESYQYIFVADAINGDSMTVTGSKEETKRNKTELKETLLSLKEIPTETAISGIELSFSENESKTKVKNGVTISRSEAATVEGRADDTGGFVRSMQQDDEDGISSVEHRKDEFDSNGGLLLSTFCRDADINDADGDSCVDANGVAVDANWQTYDPSNSGRTAFSNELNDSALNAAASAAASHLIRVSVSGLPTTAPVAPAHEVKTRFELYIGDPISTDPAVAAAAEQVGEGKQEVKANGRVKLKVRYWGSQAQLDAGTLAVYEMSYDAVTGTTTRTLIAGASVTVAP